MTLDELKLKVDGLVAQGHGRLRVYDDDADTRSGKDNTGWFLPVIDIAIYPITEGHVVIIKNEGYHGDEGYIR
jgi:hypothetical protein